jgi:hypothetical protein
MSYYKDVYGFTDEEMAEISKDYQLHTHNNPDDGRNKMPRHWLKLMIFSPPRSGCLYKGYQCNCGYEFYLRKGKGNGI